MIKFIKHKYLLVWLGLILIILFLNNSNTSFWDQDEAAYAGFALRMNETGNYLVPDFTWSEPHRKTPFHFWSIAGSYQLFGANEFATRIPSILAILGSLFSLYFLGKKTFGRDIAMLAALIMGTSLLPSLGKVSVTDATLLMFETIAFLAVWAYIQTGKWTSLLWLFLTIAGGTLVKGPPILIVTGGSLALMVFFGPNRVRAFTAGIVTIFGIMPLLVWGRIAWLSDGGTFISWLIDWYILKRTSGTVFGQTGPPGYYLLVFLLAFLPWLPMFVHALREYFKNLFSKEKRSNFDMFLFFWFSCGWFFYEIVPSKLPAYAIAAYPALALLMAKSILSLNEDHINTNKWIKGGWWLQVIFIVAISAGLIFGLAPILNEEGKWICYLIALFLFTFSMSQRLAIKGSWGKQGWIFFPAFGLGFLLLVWGLLIPSFEFERSATKRLANELKTLGAQEVVITQDFDLPSLPFYLEQNKIPYSIQETPELWSSAFSSNKKRHFVFSEDKLKQFIENVPQQKRPSVLAIKGWVSDQGKTMDYLIITN